MNKDTLIKSLKIGWKSKESDYIYLVSILRKMGYKPEFPDVPKYLKVWAIVNTGRLIGEDITEWEPKLNKEIERLTEIQKNYQLERENITREMQESRARIRANQKILRSIQDEIDEAMSRRMGYS